MKALAALLLLWMAALPVAAGAATSEFANWAAVVVAGDFHAHSGAPTQAFDNARRDVTQALLRAGFAPDNIQQFSVRPQDYPGQNLLPSDPGFISNSLWQLASKAKDGCLVYFSSHGAPQGILVGDRLFSPEDLSRAVKNACGERPTVVILSACFSGVFVAPLSGANRAVFTAARPDRTSFGCGESDKYPYYDDCILSSFPKAGNFMALAIAAKACVAAREIAEKAEPPSEPQIFVGGVLRPALPLYTFSQAP